MFCFRRLRSCWKHPSRRVVMLMILLSLLILVIMPQVFRNLTVIRLPYALYLDNNQESKALSASTANFSESSQNATSTPSFPAVALIPRHLTLSNTTAKTKSRARQESTTPVAAVKNGSLNLGSPTLKNVSSTDQNSTKGHPVPEKYLIFVCDHKMYCYGLGDRQRGIMSVYLLAVVTNRTFGIIMTSPSNFTEFYKPNLVSWDIPPSKLAGKSSVDIVAYGPKVNFGLHEIDFNVAYPQEVVYIRTNHKWAGSLLTNHHYRNKFPPWTKVPSWQLFQVSWLRLMTPTQTLREQLNEMLAHISQEMHDEYSVSKQLNNSKCCESKGPHVSSCANSKCELTEQQLSCCNVTRSNKTTDKLKTCTNGTCGKQTSFVNCINITCNETNRRDCKNTACIDQSLKTLTNIESVPNNCVNIVENKTKNVSDFSRMKTFAIKYCNESRLILQPWTSVENIHQLKGYDRANLNLVCVHIRLGHSATLPLENNVRNRPDTVKVVWNFLKPYVAKGQHVYLASDSQEVRQQAMAIFGDRVHVSSVPIVHIALVKKGQDERSAFSLTLVEQLLLTTSCKVLIISYSGFSMKAAQIRHQLGGDSELYMFKNGVVAGKGVKWLLK